MCGFAGFRDFAAQIHPHEYTRITTAMSDSLVHRGPDDGGIWTDAADGVGLGHRRLSIIDLSAEGHQPMQSSDGSMIIIFNGEIYNFEEIRKDLLSRGHSFRGHSDTEVMLAAFLEWGVEAATRRFNGMFAFALWERRQRVLTFGRDRLGKKPLYYGWCGDVLLFGSELKALRAHPAFDAAIDENALALYLRHGYVPSPWSIYKGIYKLPAGCTLRVPASSTPTATLEPERYWSATAAAARGLSNPLGASVEESMAGLRDLLEDAVRIRMVSDVPLGAFLSGGIDSSLVVGLMQSLSTRPVKTFSIGFEERVFDEAAYAKAVAQHLGTEHTELYVTAAEAMDVIPRLPEMFDEPFGDSSQIPTFLVSELARRHVTVSLSGDGGDELFGGYHAYFSNSRAWSKYARMPRPVRSLAAKVIRGVSPDSWTRMFDALSGSTPNAGARLHRLAGSLDQDAEEVVYRNMISHWSDPSEVLPDTAEPLTGFTDPSNQLRQASFFERMMAVDAITYLPDDILVKVDRASMAVSLEARCPLLDYRVFEYAWSMPLDLKVREDKGKWPLRQILYSLVPPELIERPKSGFAVPVGEWLRGPLRDWAESLLDERRLEAEGIFRPEPIREKWSAHVTGTADCLSEVWDILMFQAWRESTHSAGVHSPNKYAHGTFTD